MNPIVIKKSNTGARPNLLKIIVGSEMCITVPDIICIIMTLAVFQIHICLI